MSPTVSSASTQFAAQGVEDPLASAASRYDRAAARPRVEAAEAVRAEILKRFPKSDWPTLPLERYALGQENGEDTYCRWVEFRSYELGSISGGSSEKMVIFKRRNRDGWYYPETRFASLEEAWNTLRSSIVDAFRLAEAGEWEQIDFLPALEFGPVLCVKSLHVYFPGDVLPIYGRESIRHFLRLFGVPDESTKALRRVALNRRLLEAVRAHPALHGWSTTEVGAFLYTFFSPRDVARMVKIAPGENARYWEDCLRNSYICVGWDAVGDLDRFDTKTEFKNAFASAYGETYRQNRPKISAKGNELWTLRELEAGDLVIANQGTSKVLAIGEVVAPGYEWRSNRPEYRHTVRVRWDTTVARSITPQSGWATVTVAKVTPELYKQILSGQPDPDGGTSNGGEQAAPPVPLDPELLGLVETLERKGQLILYGPPGTGKTYTANRLAVAFLLRSRNEDSAAALSDASRFHAAQLRLSNSGRTGVPVLTRLTFHPSYAYEDFIEGFRPYDNGTGSLALRLEDGVFKHVTRAALDNPGSRYVVLIDEINRANLGKVFGESITLLERDKRGLAITLPQSKQSFRIPENVYIVGTMNTADRSIKLLDAALRRRFAFHEVMPDAGLLQGAEVGALALDEFLEELNRRVARGAGREKQIGHSFLMDGETPITDPDEFARRFRQEILPLLQEYCYEDYGALAAYLGPKIVDADRASINSDVISDSTALLLALEEQFASEQTGGT